MADTCPPCNGHCRQGRDCPAVYVEPDGEQSEGLTIGETIAVFSVMLLALMLLGALVVIGLRALGVA